MLVKQIIHWPEYIVTGIFLNNVLSCDLLHKHNQNCYKGLLLTPTRAISDIGILYKAWQKNITPPDHLQGDRGMVALLTYAR